MNLYKKLINYFWYDCSSYSRNVDYNNAFDVNWQTKLLDSKYIYTYKLHITEHTTYIMKIFNYRNSWIKLNVVSFYTLCCFLTTITVFFVYFFFCYVHFQLHIHFSGNRNDSHIFIFLTQYKECIYMFLYFIRNEIFMVLNCSKVWESALHINAQTFFGTIFVLKKEVLEIREVHYWN